MAPGSSTDRTSVPDLTVTARARAALDAELVRTDRKAVRLLPLGGAQHGLGLAVSLTRAPLPSDLCFDLSGLSLCVAPDLARIFDGLELDHTGSAFTFRARATSE